MPFYIFHQSHNGGGLIVNCDIGHDTIVEARNAAEANDRAETLGIFFDGDAPMDDWHECESCGDRWERVNDDGGDAHRTLADAEAHCQRSRCVTVAPSSYFDADDGLPFRFPIEWYELRGRGLGRCLYRSFDGVTNFEEL